jgi:hypothetical protein
MGPSKILNTPPTPAGLLLVPTIWLSHSAHKTSCPHYPTGCQHQPHFLVYKRSMSTFLYYAQTVDSTTCSSSLLEPGFRPSQRHRRHCTTGHHAQLLNHVATHLDTTIQFITKGTTLRVYHSKASYLSEAKARIPEQLAPSFSALHAMIPTLNLADPTTT